MTFDGSGVGRSLLHAKCVRGHLHSLVPCSAVKGGGREWGVVRHVCLLGVINCTGHEGTVSV